MQLPTFKERKKIVSGPFWWRCIRLFGQLVITGSFTTRNQAITKECNIIQFIYIQYIYSILLYGTTTVNINTKRPDTILFSQIAVLHTWEISYISSHSSDHPHCAFSPIFLNAMMQQSQQRLQIIDQCLNIDENMVITTD